MSKKIPLGIFIGLLIIAVAATSVITATYTKNEYNNILKGLPEKAQRYEIIDELDSIINNNYYSNSENKDIEKAIAKGYVSGLPDKYSRYMTADEYSEYQSETNGDMYGIGIAYSKNSKGYIVVDEVFDGSPAKSGGIVEGDVIIAFDSIKIDASNYDEAVEKLEGAKLNSLNITIRRGSEETTLNVAKGYEAKSVSSKTYGSVGYLKISDFYSSTAAQVQQTVDSFISSGVTSLVIDLRKNSGENFNNAMAVLDIFVPMNDTSSPAAKLVDKAGNVIEKYSTTAGEVNLPIAILVSSGTQAAAEMFACNMRDFGKARLVGTKTKGTAFVRKAFVLTTGDAVLLSIGEMLPYKSGSFNKVGIEPDVVSELEEKTNKIEADSQFLAAVSMLSPGGGEYY